MPDRPENELPKPERTPIAERRDWENVQTNPHDVTERLLVAGGYLYRTILGADGQAAGREVALVFVPFGEDD